jgi:hypothetical protein
MGKYGNIAQEVRNVLTDARALCEQLGLTNGAKKQRTGLLICCPAHGEKNPSCSVTLAPSGTIRVKCFSCDWSGDALTLVAKVHDLDLKIQFREVLITAAGLAGRSDLADALQNNEAYEPKPAPVRPAPAEPEYPNRHELTALWAAAHSVTTDAETVAHLTFRTIDVAAVAQFDLARVLPPLALLPRWASYHGEPWTQTGHRLLLPVYDVDGVFRSVRAWRIIDGETPKRLPPGGHKAAELVLANAHALAWLRHSDALPYTAPPFSLMIVEGEPDFLVRATLNNDEAIVGLMSGSWHQGFADKLPHGSEILLRTHLDRAGDKYAADVTHSVRNCGVQVHRIEVNSIATAKVS